MAPPAETREKPRTVCWTKERPGRAFRYGINAAAAETTTKTAVAAILNGIRINKNH